jgi:hypothetical protein
VEWERAKNLILLFFVLLNLTLAAFLFTENRRYTVSAEHENVIRSVLARHGINMDAEMIRRFPPMRALRLSGYYYDEDRLLDIFFEDPSRVERAEIRSGTEFVCGNALMWVSGGFVTYLNDDGLNADAGEIITRYFPDFVRDEFFTPHDEEGLRLVYRQVYRGNIIYSNFIEFLITDAGIVEVDIQFGRVYGFDGPEPFIQRAHVHMPNRPLTIWHMDIVYVLEFANASDERGSTHMAIPFYRIFVEGYEMPFLINAYMNVSIDD